MAGSSEMYNNSYMYGYLSMESRVGHNLGWAKAPLRRAIILGPDARPNGGHVIGRIRVRCLCPPYKRGIAIQPYRRMANPRQLFRYSVAAAASRAAAHPPRKSRFLPHEKSAPQFCRQFV